MSETVKLIIEIPKVEYELIVGEHEVIVGSGVCELKTLPKAVAEGIPLDDVKAEIEEKISHYDHFQGSNTAHGLEIALEIIDKHIGDKG